MASEWLTPDVVAAVCAYMNEHQPDSVAEIVRRHAAPGEGATLVDLTVEEAVFATSRGAVRVAWSMPVTHRSQIREELVSLAAL